MTKKVKVTEDQLKKMFEENFERLRMENGHSLSPHVKKTAWNQVQMYWRKLSYIAEGVTDTEVHLSLPNKKTKKKRIYCIEGIVDIVREDNKVTMYDIKTHDADYVRQNVEDYCGQINVYADIWQNLQKQKLDEAAIIATRIPDDLQQALDAQDTTRMKAQLTAWKPVIPIPFSAANVKKTVDEFGDVVDKIQDHEFSPSPVSRLKKREGKRDTFATRVCRNCDARFSCDSYCIYALKNKDKSWRKFADFYDLEPNEAEEIIRVEASMPIDVNVEQLADDI
jgi:radical SAM protein with 4Fe4S-binding SPASM domain